MKIKTQDEIKIIGWIDHPKNQKQNWIWKIDRERETISSPIQGSIRTYSKSRPELHELVDLYAEWQIRLIYNKSKVLDKSRGSKSFYYPEKITLSKLYTRSLLSVQLWKLLKKHIIRVKLLSKIRILFLTSIESVIDSHELAENEKRSGKTITKKIIDANKPPIFEIQLFIDRKLA